MTTDQRLRENRTAPDVAAESVALRVLIKKKRDGSAALSCIRPDGSVTWQRQEGPNGAFFPLHDLTHFAVETVLGYKQAFFGLMASGWSFPDFGKPWPRGPLPFEAGYAELIVGLLDMERATGTILTGDEFHEQVRLFGVQHGIEFPRVIDDEKLGRLRAKRSELFQLWNAKPAGETLELTFGVS